MKLFIIRHNKTRNYLPQKYVRGGTYWNGEEGESGLPRIFHSRNAANAFIYAWEKGYAGVDYGTDKDEFGRPYEYSKGVNYVDQGRSRSDLSVVECELVIERN